MIRKSMVLTVLALGLFSVTSHAEEGKVTSLLFNCNLSFNAHGKSIYIGLGYTHLEGKGKLSCYDLATGASQHIDLKVNAIGPGAGLGVTGLNLSGAAIGVKIAKNPESLLGRYVSARANAAAGIGAGVSVPLRFSKDDVSINVEFEGQTGLGAGVDILSIDIEAEGKPQFDDAPVVTKSEVVEAPVVRQAVRPVIVNNAKVIYVEENQPVEIVDENGRVVRTILLKSKGM